jgi:adenine-specific DNA-methyltransferase
VLSKCEWDRDDYSLNVANLPMAKSEAEIEQEKMAEELPLFGRKEG